MSYLEDAHLLALIVLKQLFKNIMTFNRTQARADLRKQMII